MTQPVPFEEFKKARRTGPRRTSANVAPGPKCNIDPIDVECASFPCTDLGNAQRFIKRFGSDLAFVPQWGWLFWNGSHWKLQDAEAEVSRRSQKAIKLIEGEAASIRGTDLDYMIEGPRGSELKSEKLAKWCLASQSAAHIRAVPQLAQAHLNRSTSEFDADPMAINVKNGTLRFSKCDDGDYVTLDVHRREDLFTRLAPVVFDPLAECPIYDVFLARVQPDEDIRRNLHAWGGVSLTGMQIARLAFWYGTGRNGKSTLSESWAYVMGEYSQSIPIETFLDQGRSRRAGEATPDLAQLPGVRFLRTSEPGNGTKLQENMIKLVTGGESIRVRHLNQDFFEFKPVFKPTMQGNYKPRIDGTDEGIWSRFMLVPFTVMVPESERDPDLLAKLKAEASGILNRLLDGLRDYMDHGLVPAAAVAEATAAYRAESDPVGRFLADCTEKRPPAEQARVSGKAIYELYAAWARAQAERIWTPKSFSRGLQDHGITRMKSNGIYYRGLQLTKSVADFEREFFSDEGTK